MYNPAWLFISVIDTLRKCIRGSYLNIFSEAVSLHTQLFSDAVPHFASPQAVDQGGIRSSPFSPAARPSDPPYSPSV